MRALTPRRDEKGASIVEFAIAGGLFFLLVLGVFDFGRAILYYNMLSNAAREGARYGVIASRAPDEICLVAGRSTQLPGVDYSSLSGCNPAGDPLAITLVTRGTQSSSDSSGKRVFGQPVELVLTYDFEPVTPLIAALVTDPLTGKLTLAASASMYVED